MAPQALTLMGPWVPPDQPLAIREPTSGPNPDLLHDAAQRSDAFTFKNLTTEAFLNGDSRGLRAAGIAAIGCGRDFLIRPERVHRGVAAVVTSVPARRFADLHPQELTSTVRAQLDALVVDVRLTYRWPVDGDRVVDAIRQELGQIIKTVGALVDGTYWPNQWAAVECLFRARALGLAFGVAGGVDDANGQAGLGLRYASKLRKEWGHTHEALRVAERLERYGQDPAVCRVLAAIHRRLGNLEDAYRYALGAVALEPGDIFGANTLAPIATKLGHHQVVHRTHELQEVLRGPFRSFDERHLRLAVDILDAAGWPHRALAAPLREQITPSLW